jgi:FtsP/CotA-like multicopper oxidase with cupredoxin domain
MPPMLPGFGMAQSLAGLEPAASPYLPAHTPGLVAARPREVVDLGHGDTLTLVAAPVLRVIGGRRVVMFGFNGQYPGPLIRVARHAEIVVDFRNQLDWPSAVHWHGIRLENRFDGVPGVTQAPVPPGGRFVYRIRFPDAGIYWYHPHHREDVLQDLGLYGNILVAPDEPAYYGPSHAEEALILDDLLVDEAGILPYGRETATFALMGRFGNLLLVNGEPRWERTVQRGEVVRLFLTNVASTRTFNVSLPGARMKRVAADVGRFERESWVESVVLAPAERAVVDVRFPEAGRVPLVNAVQALDHVAGVFVPQADTLGIVTVRPARARPDLAAAFARLRAPAAVAQELAPLRRHLARAPDRELLLTLEHEGLPFPLIQLLRLDTAWVTPVEWSGTMPMMDWLPTGREVRWTLREPSTGHENDAIAWRFRRGELVKLRLRNDRHTLHPMAHPIHLHGQRFVVLARNGVPVGNLAWKDTALLPAGQTMDLLVEMSNPGRWMLHCHIAEHLEAGMQMVFTVDDAAAAR